MINAVSTLQTKHACAHASPGNEYGSGPVPATRVCGRTLTLPVQNVSSPHGMKKNTKKALIETAADRKLQKLHLDAKG